MDSTIAAMDVLAAAVERAAPEGWAWINGQPLETAFSGAGRRCRGPADFNEVETRALLRAGVAAPETWTLAEAARAWLLLRRVERLDEDEHVPLVRRLFLTGDNGERMAVLKTLPLLPRPERFVDLALDACRTNVKEVFEALACDNAYPAAHFPEAGFNQMVLKAVFIGAPLGRVVGLADRLNPELSRMARDYAAERRAAGRPVPEDLALVTPGGTP